MLLLVAAAAASIVVALQAAAGSDGTAEVARISVLERAAAARPSKIALAELAEAYAAVDDPGAEAAFRRALAAAPDDADLSRAHAEFLWKKQRNEEGNAEMERLLARTPADTELRCRYGAILMQQSRFVQAADQFSRACASPARCSTDNLGLWASALLETGRFAESARIWRRAIDAAPDSAAPHHGLGRLRLLQGDSRGAAAELAIAARLDPSSAAIRVDHGRALEGADAGDATAAEAEYREALRLDPTYAAARYALGALLARLGRADEAKSEMALYQASFQASQEVRQRGGSRRARLALGWTRLEANDAAGAVEAFSGLGEDPEALRGRAEALLRLGRAAEARSLLERAAALSPADPRIRWALARASRGAETAR